MQAYNFSTNQADNGMRLFMPRPDANKEALDQVEQATDSEPVKGDDLVESEELKRKFREAKERLREPIGEQTVE